MWLIHTEHLTLHQFYGADIPKYAILSHRWQGEEVSFRDMSRARRSPQLQNSWEKILGFCHVARFYGLEHAWVDTCCIDKSSSAELSEAINSMHIWYKRAKICIVYLFDLDLQSTTAWRTDFEDSEWFTRGWTLQELLGPMALAFFDVHWRPVGKRGTALDASISRATNISEFNLREFSRFPASISIAQKLSWMSKRQTKRPEDMAYSLIGIFNVNMPLLYGEGGKKAFARLQLEIIKKSDDDSIFVWTRSGKSDWRSLLAPSPAGFTHVRNICMFNRADHNPYYMTNRGLHMDLRLHPEKSSRESSKENSKEESNTWRAPLDCGMAHNSSRRVVLVLQRDGPKSERYLLCTGVEFRDDKEFPAAEGTSKEVFVCCETPRIEDDEG